MIDNSNLPPGVSVMDEHINPSDPKPKKDKRPPFKPRVFCPKCKGMGLFENVRCQECNGLGTQRRKVVER